MTKRIKAFAPATIANLSCGFDVLGLAVQQPGDEVEVTLNDSGRVTIDAIFGDGGNLPLEATRNTSGVAIIEFLRATHHTTGASVVLHKNLPLGSGMGSSAASAVAAVVAINELLGRPLKKKELLPFVMEAERVACGSAHADNAAPCLLGGLILIRENNPLDIIEIPTPKDLVCVLVHPHVEVKTRDARAVLKPTIALKDGIKQWANTAALVAGMMKNDYDLIGRALVDVIAEPLRADLIPGFWQAKEAALKNGALGCGISGSGPTVFCLCHGRENAIRAGKAIQQVFLSLALASEIFVSEINREGAHITH
ncbi:MAG: homoserine kinase [Bacteroidetes bacterium]|nr:homoserine kinase [Bacteroidota bacterium]